jgi:hypothetical protein
LAVLAVFLAVLKNNKKKGSIDSMKITIPVMTQEIRLADYAPEFEGAIINVHINPRRELLMEWDELITRDKQNLSAEELQAISKRINEILAELWSWPVEDVSELEQRAQETDPKLLTWLIGQTFKNIIGHRTLRKLNE